VNTETDRRNCDDRTRNLRIAAMSLLRLRKDRTSSVALLFAIMAIGVIGLVGAAVDYGFWNQTVASLSLAANGAALNAVKVAAAGELANDTNYLTEGTTAGTNWFEAQINTNAAHFTNPVPTVNVSGTTTVTATVTYSSEVNSIFGRWFGMKQYPISVSATAVIQNAPYLEVVMMLDNSSSMDIGATPADMQKLMQYSGCDTSNVYYANSAGNYVNDSEDEYGVYQYKSTYGNYDGTLATPVVNSNGLVLTPALNGNVGTCTPANVTSGYCSVKEQCPQTINGKPTYAGPPCAFACHWDNTKQAGLGTDLWAAARKNGVTLRLDLVKNATNTVLDSMKQYNVNTINNLSVGIYTFNVTLSPVYPEAGCTPQTFGCESGTAFDTAISDVGLPPQGSGVYTDTGIQPVVGSRDGAGQVNGSNNDSAISEAMTELANNYVTAAGNGTSPTSPRKVLFLITDGFEDSPYTGQRAAMPASSCQQFKNLGFTVYVVYTPYYPVMHSWYLQNGIPIAEGTGSSSITYNLEQCSSYTNASNLNTYFIEATNQTELTTALSGFLQSALQQSAKFTQ